jgi:hypothetical protein
LCEDVDDRAHRNLNRCSDHRLTEAHYHVERLGGSRSQALDLRIDSPALVAEQIQQAYVGSLKLKVK